jgi:outer membrane protein assembly factor BamB
VHRRFIVIDIIAALIVVGGIVAVGIVVFGRSSGPKPTPFPTQALTQSPTPSPTPSPSSSHSAAPPTFGNWPTYGYNAARTRFDPLISLRPPFRTKWRYKAKALLEFPPSIYENDLYVCTEHGMVICLKAANRHVIWRYKLPPGSQFASTPTVDATSVYVTSLAGRFLVLNRLTGKLRWGLAGIGRSESSPLVWRGRVFFGSEDGNVYAMSLATHKLVWRYHTGGAVKGAPAELGGRIVVGAYDGALYCLSYNGNLLWRRSTSGVLSSNQFYATAALAYDTAYIGGTGGSIYAFALSNGGLRWSFATGGYVYSSPAVWRNLVFEGSYDDYFYALNAASGSLVWRFYAGGSVSGAPTVLNGIVYVSSFAGRTWGLDARTGRVVWRFGDGKYSPVTADQRTLYLNGYHTLYALVPKR